MPVAVPLKNKKLQEVPTVDLPEGDFLYILCKIFETERQGAGSDFKYIIRGEARTRFHADIFDMLESICDNLGITCFCQGGGRITHNPDKKSVYIYGTSQAYGPADHKLAASIVREELLQYKDVTWSYG